MAVFAGRQEPRSTGGYPEPWLARDGAAGEGKVDERERAPRTHRNAETSTPTPGGRMSGEDRFGTSSTRVRSYQH